MTVIFVMFWTWELIMAVYTMNVLSDAAKEGVRCGILHGTWQASPPACIPANPGSVPAPSNCPAVDGLVKYYAASSLHNMSGMTVSVTYPDTTCLTPNRVRVDVTYPLIPYFGVLKISPTLHAAAEGRFIF